jgi:hypothetical protein
MLTSGGALLSLCTTIPSMRGASAFAMQQFPYLIVEVWTKKIYLITTRTNRILSKCCLPGVAGKYLLYLME